MTSLSLPSLPLIPSTHQHGGNLTVYMPLESPSQTHSIGTRDATQQLLQYEDPSNDVEVYTDS